MPQVQVHPAIDRDETPPAGEPEVLISMTREEARQLAAIAARVSWSDWPFFNQLFDEFSRRALYEHSDLSRVLLRQAARADGSWGVLGRRSWT